MIKVKIIFNKIIINKINNRINKNKYINQI